MNDFILFISRLLTQFIVSKVTLESENIFFRFYYANSFIPPGMNRVAGWKIQIEWETKFNIQLFKSPRVDPFFYQQLPKRPLLGNSISISIFLFNHKEEKTFSFFIFNFLPVLGQFKLKRTSRIILLTFFYFILLTFFLLLTGAIFNEESSDLQNAFKYAIQVHNTNSTAKFKAEPIIDVVDIDDPFKVTNACEYLFFVYSFNW